MSVLSLVVTLALGQNVVLVHYLGVYPLPAILHSPRRAAAMSLAVTGAVLWVSLMYWVAFHFVLVPLDLEVLDTVVGAVVVAFSTVGGVRLATVIAPYRRREIRQFVPAALVNVTVFVVALSLVEQFAHVGYVAAGALAVGAGFALATIPLAAVRRELRDRRVPRILQGDVVVYLTLAMMALAIQQIDGLLVRYLVPVF